VHLPEIDKYAHLDSPLHRWDARARLPAMVALLLAAVLSPSHAAALAGLGVALGLVALSRIPAAFVFLHARWVVLFCLVLATALALTGGGPLVRVGPVLLSRPGLSRAGLISLRAVAAVLLVFPTVGTAPFHVTLKALRRLRVPSVAVQILAFSYRYIFVLLDEWERMACAARARGHGRARGLRLLANTGNMAGMLAVRSLNRTSRVHRAMLARGYRGEVRTLDDFRLVPSDLFKAALVVVAAGCVLAVGWLP